jgi:hypothetical protein
MSLIVIYALRLQTRADDSAIRCRLWHRHGLYSLYHAGGGVSGQFLLDHYYEQLSYTSSFRLKTTMS